jgi:hypothetical protein
VSSKVLLVHLTERQLATAIVESSLSTTTITAVQLSSADKPQLPAGPFDRVLATLPASTALFRLLDLPFRDRGRLAQAVGPALEGHVPISLEEGTATFDYSGADHEAPVLAAIARDEELQKHQTRLEEIGANPSRLLWEAPTTMASYRAAAGPTTFMAVDASESGAVLASYEAGTLTGLRVINACAPELFKRNLTWSLSALDNSAPTLFIGGSLAEVAAQAADEAGLSAERRPLPETPPIPCAVAAPWDDLAPLAGLALIAAGEAEAPIIDFSSQGSSLLSAVLEIAAEFRPVLPWAAAALLLACTSVTVDYVGLFQARNQLEQKAETIYRGVMNEGSGGAGRRLKFEMRLSELGGARNSAGARTGSPLESLTVLSAALPAKLEVEIEEFRQSLDGVRLRGRAASFETVTQVEEALRRENAFSDVEVRDVHAATSGEGVDFQIVLRGAGS